MTAPMSDDELAQIKAREQDATEGPWRSEVHVQMHEPGYEVYLAPPDGGYFGSAGTVGWADRKADAEFIAHARTDVPRLLAEAERLRAAEAAVQAVLAVARERGPNISCGGYLVTDDGCFAGTLAAKVLRAIAAAGYPTETKEDA